ncbi:MULTISPECIES: GLPGLI family protein [Niastella]|uniref:GLPGLI family protein n=1 Tax=Niastella soli TaxID=2821487 RepID=A0ABS3YPM3_9BACT|nr:GLPGLI family protein [Niastella soli]MBO9199834.1 GLPGLI family protein [Niastella soli]
MKTIYFIASLFVTLQAYTQQQSGRVVYEFTRQMMVRTSVAGEGMEGPPPPPRKYIIKQEVLFGNNQMLRRMLEDVVNEIPDNDNGNQFHFAMGDDDITWFNFADGRKVEQREFATKQYLITDSAHKLNWKLTGETSKILGYTCQQAVATRPGKRSMMSIENGEMTRKDIPDTSHITAWFTPVIPVPAGPDLEGQLPGLILQIDINGNTMYKALEVSQQVDLAAIKEPKKGKKVTAEEFSKERDKTMEDIQRNGGRRVMRINN